MKGVWNRACQRLRRHSGMSSWRFRANPNWLVVPLPINDPIWSLFVCVRVWTRLRAFACVGVCERFMRVCASTCVRGRLREKEREREREREREWWCVFASIWLERVAISGGQRTEESHCWNCFCSLILLLCCTVALLLCSTAALRHCVYAALCVQFLSLVPF